MTDNDEGLLLTRIVIERRLVGDEDLVVTDFADRDGDAPPLFETLGLLELAKDTVVRAAMDEISPDDD